MMVQLSFWQLILIMFSCSFFGGVMGLVCLALLNAGRDLEDTRTNVL